MRSTTTRRLVAGITAGIAAAAASAVLLLAPTAAEAGHTLQVTLKVRLRSHSEVTLWHGVPEPAVHPARSSRLGFLAGLVIVVEFR